MKDENIKIPIVMTGLFLITSPIIQWVFGLLGGFIVYSINENLGESSRTSGTLPMLAIAVLGIIWFIIAKSSFQKWMSSFLVLFSICNAFLFFSYGNLREYFYPDRYIIGAIVSGILLTSIGIIKKKTVANTK